MQFKIFALLFSCCLILTVSAAVSIQNPAIPVESPVSIHRTYSSIVILDPGHGGEDGGAVAADGTLEKDLNLKISNNIDLLFCLFGIPSIRTRSSDYDLADSSLPSIRERKRSDILERYRIVNSHENGILLSIHQNMFNIKKYHGTQVFYAPNSEQSLFLAREIRSAVRNALQSENDREVKPSGDSIYLLYRATKPSVLVECGFLSNEEELTNLKDPNYDVSLGYCITRGLLNFLNKQEN